MSATADTLFYTMTQIDGLDKVLKNIDKKEADIYKATGKGMDYALTQTRDYIKDEFVWSTKHKGFDDRTGFLRNSIQSKVENQAHFIGKGYVHGWIYATETYAPYVELRWEGKHAYMYPGFRDKEKWIYELIGEAVKTAIDASTL